MNIQNAFMMILRMVPRAFSSLLVAMCMAFVVSGRMALIYLGAVIFLGVILAILMGIAARYFRRAFPEYDVLNENTEENIAAIRVVKASTAVKRRMRRSPPSPNVSTTSS